MKRILFLFFLVSLSVFSQERKTMYGKVFEDTSPVKNAHVINVQTKKATYTNPDGDFRIFAKIGDSLRVTSVQYETKIYVVNDLSFGFNDVQIFLKRKVVELDEVSVKLNDLNGTLSSDIKKTPKDRRAEALAKTMDFSNIDMDAEVPDDHIDKNVRPHLVNTDPTMNFAGAGTKIYMPFKYSEKLWALRKELAFKKSFPTKIFNELGEKFFFEQLKIPVERYYHFLEYCNPLGIEKLYQENKILEVIKILEEEHVEYLKIIKKQ